MTMQIAVTGQGSGQKTVDMTANGSFSPGSHMAQMAMACNCRPVRGHRT